MPKLRPAFAEKAEASSVVLGTQPTEFSTTNVRHACVLLQPWPVIQPVDGLLRLSNLQQTLHKHPRVVYLPAPVQPYKNKSDAAAIFGEVQRRSFRANSENIHHVSVVPAVFAGARVIFALHDRQCMHSLIVIIAAQC